MALVAELNFLDIDLLQSICSEACYQGSSTNSLQERDAFVTESYSFEHIFLYCGPIFSLKYAIDQAQRDLLIAYTKVRIA